MSDNDNATVPDDHEDDLISVVVSDYESSSDWATSDFGDEEIPDSESDSSSDEHSPDESSSLSDFNGSDSDLRLLLSKTGRKKSERKYFNTSRSVARSIARRLSKFSRKLNSKNKFTYQKL